MAKVILENKRFGLTIERLCHQLKESYSTLDDVCFIGIQERGVILGERIVSKIKKLYPKQTPVFGKLDISFYRDDFRRRDKPIKVSSTDIEFLVEGKNVILIDDVLYTGRTVHAAIAALMDFGRPKKLEFLTLVDRRFNRHFPIRADYAGIIIDALDDEYVKVEWEHLDGEDKVLLFSSKEKMI
jgi:pyrimidine operon attenuation protein/uracil phosphoribosyltransferase